MAGRVEAAVRAAVPIDLPLRTPSGRGRFTVTRYTTEGLVLLLGEKEAWTPLPWRALEEVPDLLRGRGWVRIRSVYSMESVAGTLDAHLKQYLARATAGWGRGGARGGWGSSHGPHSTGEGQARAQLVTTLLAADVRGPAQETWARTSGRGLAHGTRRSGPHVR